MPHVTGEERNQLFMISMEEMVSIPAVGPNFAVLFFYEFIKCCDSFIMGHAFVF